VLPLLLEELLLLLDEGELLLEDELVDVFVLELLLPDPNTFLRKLPALVPLPR
jgi:hypothetical protein